MREDQREVWVLLQNAAEDEAATSEGRLGGVPDQVPQVIIPHAGRPSHIVGVDENGQVVRRCPFP